LTQFNLFLSELGYVLYKVLHRSRTSRVYLACDAKHGDMCIVKQTSRIDVSEADIMRRINSPAIPGIRQVIANADETCVIMDYAAGTPLSQLVAHNGALSEHDVISIAMQLADIVNYLHNQPTPIIHRDIKPSNVIVGRDAKVMLIDFGAAGLLSDNKSMNTGTCTGAFGTAGYAAPEQYIPDDPTDVRTDIYGIGALMYNAAVGHKPTGVLYDASSLDSPDRYRLVSYGAVLSDKLQHIIGKCVQFDPARRYQTCRELMEDLCFRI